MRFQLLYRHKRTGDGFGADGERRAVVGWRQIVMVLGTCSSRCMLRVVLYQP